MLCRSGVKRSLSQPRASTKCVTVILVSPAYASYAYIPVPRFERVDVMSWLPTLELTLQSTQTAERRARYKVSAWKASTPSHEYVHGKIDAPLWQQRRLHAHYKQAFSRLQILPKTCPPARWGHRPVATNDPVRRLVALFGSAHVATYA